VVHNAEFSRAWAAMQEIADWLTRLGLPEYADAFAENGIDVAVLPHLTDQDLKDIGVLLGHRRKILAAVAELPGKSPSAPKPFPPLVEARDRHTTEPPQPAPAAPPPTKRLGPGGVGSVSLDQLMALLIVYCRNKQDQTVGEAVTGIFELTINSMPGGRRLDLAVPKR
jgi:SAM domain (Sterile alpha motif)